MKTLFIAPGPITWASARLRMFWPAQYMPDTEVVSWEGFQELHKQGYRYDNYIFSKRFEPAAIDELNQLGKRVYWDVCDPLHWFAPDVCRTIADGCVKVVCSTQKLADDFNHWYKDDKALCIPDRLELSHFPLKRKHEETNPIRFIWFGLAVNRHAMFGGLVNLERLVANGHKLELTIMDDHPELDWSVTNAFPIRYVPWSLETENEILAQHDLAFLPPYPGPWGQVKSNNKKLTAWACNLPVVSEYYSDYEVLMSAIVRENYASIREKMLATHQVQQSAAEWGELFHV